MLDYGELLYMNTPDQFIKESDTVTAVLCDLLQVADIMYITGPYRLSHWLTFIYKSILGPLLTYLCLDLR